jgi:hypothetical protein
MHASRPVAFGGIDVLQVLCLPKKQKTIKIAKEINFSPAIFYLMVVARTT